MALLHGLHPAECRCSSCSAADEVLREIGFAQGSGVLSRRAVEGKVYEARIGHSTGYHAPEARPLVRR